MITLDIDLKLALGVIGLFLFNYGLLFLILGVEKGKESLAIVFREEWIPFTYKSIYVIVKHVAIVLIAVIVNLQLSALLYACCWLISLFLKYFFYKTVQIHSD